MPLQKVHFSSFLYSLTFAGPLYLGNRPVIPNRGAAAPGFASQTYYDLQIKVSQVIVLAL